jgi:type IV pilus assembly protein PilB
MQTLLTNKTLERLKYDLVREKLVSYEDMSKAEVFAQEKSMNIGYALVSQNLIEEKKLLEFIEQKLHIPYVNLDDYSIDHKCLSFVSEVNARKYRLIPMFKIEDVLTVAMVDPMDLFVINSIVEELEIKVEPVICSETSILKAINNHYSPKKLPFESENKHFDWTTGLLNENADEEQIRKIINNIFFAAANSKNRMITLQRECKGLGINFGKAEKGVVPDLLIPKFVACLKGLSNLDENTVDLPQLGKYCFESDNKFFTAIISTFPTIKGERISVKLFEPPPALENFIKSKTEFDKIIDMTSKSGFIAVCGAESEGKTLFIYSLLSSLASLNKNIITLESKVKYELQGVNQAEVNEDTVFNTLEALKHITFQNPDVIYIENIFDKKVIDSISFLEGIQKTIITEITADNQVEALAKAKLLQPLISVVFVKNQIEAEILFS